MKVLLIGEFSKVHNNLQYGLEQLGVTVDTINTGDGFKKFSSDIKQFQIAKDKKYDFIRNFYSKCLYEYIHRKYDVVQFIHELELGEKYGLERNLGARLAKNARLSVLLQAGCNWQYFKYAKKKMGISPCEECLKYDAKNKRGCPVAHDTVARKTTYQLQKSVDVIVPMAYEYFICSQYSPFAEKIVSPIGLPIDLESIVSDGHPRKKKLLVYHPLNREGFKGTVMIKKAFRILNQKYSDIAEFIIKGKMSYQEYSALMKEADIIVDQKNGTSFGITSLEAMAGGKIVLTGNYRKNILVKEYEYLKEAPAFELGTTVEEMVNNIADVLDKREEFNHLAKKGRIFVEQHHDSIKVAQQFLKKKKKNLCCPGAYTNKQCK